jgi:hypothetical protein
MERITEDENSGLVKRAAGSADVISGPRLVAQRMMERAQEIQREEQANSSDEEEEGFLGGDEEDPDDGVFLDNNDDPYDSDDPRSFGGKFYWDDATLSKVNFLTKVKDNTRFVFFHVLRAIGFFILVLQHFFGFNKSRFQWALDLVEKEQIRRENAIINKQEKHRK